MSMALTGAVLALIGLGLTALNVVGLGRGWPFPQSPGSSRMPKGSWAAHGRSGGSPS
jgi:hypothetical protein